MHATNIWTAFSLLFLGVTLSDLNHAQELHGTVANADSRSVNNGSRADNETPYSVRMHIHGPFSEGTGSISSTTADAALTNVDVLWWSDHDFGFTHHKVALTFNFEDWSMPRYVGENWVPVSPSDFQKLKYLEVAVDQGMTNHSASLSEEVYWEGMRSLRLDGTGANENNTGQYLYSVESERWARDESRSLAGHVTLELSIYPELISSWAYPVVDLQLSYHNDPPARLGIRYYLDNSSAAIPIVTDGVYHVPLVYEEGQWNRFVLHVTEDAISAFPNLLAEDNNLKTLQFGIEAHDGDRAVAYFDDLRIRHQFTDMELYDIQRDLLDDVAPDYPNIRQFQGLEHSGSPHLNQFSVNSALLSGNANAIVQQIHDVDGLVSLNHMFGPGNGGPDPDEPQDVLDNLLATGVYGADILEVGYRRRGGRDLPDYLWVWDKLAEHGHFLVGNGVSDFHLGRQGLTANSTNNFLSWVYAASSVKPDILEGIKKGRVFFGDITLFDGAFDLTSTAGWKMGQIVITDRDAELVSVFVDGLVPGDEARLIVNGEIFSNHIATAATLTFAENIFLGGNTSIRAEVWRGEQSVVFSNPLSFVSDVPPAQLTSHRAAIDLGGITSTGMTNLTLSGVTIEETAGQSTLSLNIDATEGLIMLNYAGHGTPVDVQLDGVTGARNFANGLLTLTELNGAGTVVIVATASTDSDGDGILDIGDNCLTEPNSGQQDTDNDSIGNACDPDIFLPNDCLVDFLDLGVMRDALFTIPDAPEWNASADLDSNGAVDFNDLDRMKQWFFSAPGPSALPNACEDQR